MGINVNMDYSTLFSSMSGSSSSSNNLMSGLSGMLSDYSSIRNGSYGKLVSAYYKKIDNEKVSSSDKTEKETKSSTTETEKSKAAEKKQYSAISSNAKDVSSKIETLTKTGDNSVFAKTWQTTENEDGTKSKVYDYDSSKISGAVSNFISSYNKLVDSTGDVSDVTTSTRASYLSKITSSYKSELSSIGITVKDDGKLSLDKDKLKAAGAEAVENVFTQKAGFGYKVSQAATSLETSASRAASSSSTYSKAGTMNSDLSSILDSFI